MELQSSTLIITFINIIIILCIISLFIFIIIKTIKSLHQSKNTNEEILKELKNISSKLDKKD
jgi:large-conductance mechanosensitive channel